MRGSLSLAGRPRQGPRGGEPEVLVAPRGAAGACRPAGFQKARSAVFKSWPGRASVPVSQSSNGPFPQETSTTPWMHQVY
ncbi:hypothetical protein VULLAG_LOCUS19152 [Vulpes lagopus]